MIVEKEEEALRGTSNTSAAGPDGIRYWLIEVVHLLRLGRDLVEEIAENLADGAIPNAWEPMVIVMIPKPRRDLTKMKSWRSINLINNIGKPGQKVVVSYLQEVPCFHAGQ